MEEKPIISFGSLPSINDPRTINSDVSRATDGPLPEKGMVDLSFNYCNELSDQKNIGICTSCAGRMAQEEYHKDGTRLDEWWGYVMQKVLIDDPMYKFHYEGSSALTKLKCANRYGTPSMKVGNKYPLKKDGTYEQFWNSFQTTYKGKIPKEIMEDAFLHRIPGYRMISEITPDNIAREIQAGRVVIIRMSTGRNFWTDKNDKPSFEAKDLLPLRKPEVADGGHLMALNGYSGLTQKQEVSGPNSWGKRWCKLSKYGAGYYFFNLDVQRGYFTEAWVILEQAPKFVFNRDLMEGNMGADVTALQKVLESEGLLIMPLNVPYGYFGPLTKRAVIKFQELYASEILTPANLKKGTGYVGIYTREKLNNV